MALGDFLEMKQRACQMARYVDTDVTDLIHAGEYINEGYLSIATDGHPWDWSFFEGQITLVVDSDEYTYAAIATALGIDGIKEIHHIVNDTTGFGPLMSMEWDRQEYNAGSTGDGDLSSEPVSWSKFVDNGVPTVKFWPPPVQAYSMGVFGTISPAVMSADGNTPLIPLAWRHRILVRYAVIQLLRQEGGIESHREANEFQRQYDRDYAEFRRTYASAKLPTFTLTTPGYDADLPSVTSYDSSLDR